MSSYDKELAAVFQKHEVVFNKNLNCDDRKYLELSVKELRYWNWWAFVTFTVKIIEYCTLKNITSVSYFMIFQKSWKVKTNMPSKNCACVYVNPNKKSNSLAELPSRIFDANNYINNW